MKRTGKTRKGMKKRTYQSPETEIFHLSSRQTIMDEMLSLGGGGSASGGGNPPLDARRYYRDDDEDIWDGGWYDIWGNND